MYFDARQNPITRALIVTLRRKDTLDHAHNLLQSPPPAELYPTRAEIDLRRLVSNLDVMRRRAGGSEVMAVVKADAYGHGAVPVSRALEKAGVDYLAVAQLQEAVELRRAGIRAPILVMGVPLPRDLRVYSELDLDVLVASPEWARRVAEHVSPERPLSVHLKVDTGMHRLGMEPAAALETTSILESARGVKLAGLWTHLASADERENPFTLEQYRALKPVIDKIGDRFSRIHFAASHAVHYFPEVSVSPDKSLIRIGLSLYGYLQDPASATELGLEPVMRVVSRVAQTRIVEAGETVSYNRRWTASRRSEIATVSCGYADGYFRSLTNRAQVSIGGRRYPVVGTVCMDLIMVDLGQPGSSAVKEGDPVVLFGEGGPSAHDVAQWAGTIVYEVCTNVSRRVARVHLG